MAIIRPFKGVRPDPKLAHLVASVPYDVVDRNEAADLAKGNPINFLRVTRSEIELPEDTDPYSFLVYSKARDNYLRLKNENILLQDEQSHFYVYKLKMGEQEQVGIVATYSVQDYDINVILKHEKTRKVKEDDRTNHIVTTEAQTGAVFLTYKGVPEINQVVTETTLNEPVYDFIAPDGVRHTVWIMPQDFHDIVVFEIDKVKNLYIADGHHRAASASRAQKVKKENMIGHTEDKEYNYFLAVLFPAEQLKIMPYNRVVYELGMSPEKFMEKISVNFSVEKVNYSQPKEKKNICMYLKSSWYVLVPKEGVKPGSKVGDNLDVSILQEFILNPILGIEDPRTDKNIDFIGGIRGSEELINIVDKGKAQVAFSMYPIDVQDLLNIADSGETMPPKSTWFEPKLRDGLLIHEIQ